MQWADIQKQKGSDDCGLFPITVAICLCSGVLPQDCSWEQEKMRNHLSKCFKQGFILPFHTSSSNRHHKGHRLVEKVEDSHTSSLLNVTNISIGSTAAVKRFQEKQRTISLSFAVTVQNKYRCGTNVKTKEVFLCLR